MGVTSCMNVRPMTRPAGGCHCPACPRAAAAPAHTLVLPPMALEPEVQTPAKDKKGSKMKVLKKIKKKMGLAPRSACTGGAPNNLPPLSFHRVHGENVRLSRDAATARRVESFCKGVAFSARPVRINEKVCLRFAEISNNWSGVLRFGFTSNDPSNQAHCLPKYACPDLTNKPGYWAKALAERFCEKDNILYYYVTPAGDVHFGINGEEKGIFFSGVETRGALWALLDIYGNCTGVQFCDPRAPNQIRRSLPTGLSAESDDRLAGSLRSLSIDDQLPPPRFQSQAVVPLTLHRMRGRNIRFINDRGVAARIESEFCQGYVFTARPMRPGETLVVQILATETAYAGSLAIGLTSCDPATLRPSELPDDAESLLDRPEYWVVRRDAANGLRRGDEMAVTLTVDGEVRVSRNGSPPMTVMHVDHTLRLWAFVDVYGATQKVRLLGTSMPAQQVQSPAAQLRVQLANGGAALGSGSGGTVLVVSLPPQNGGQNSANHQQGLTLASAHYIEPIATSQPQQLCLTGLPQSWNQEPSLIQCASTSQNNANTSQQALADLHVPNGLPTHPTTSSNQCLASPPITASCSDRMNNQAHSGQSLPHAQSFPQHPGQLASHLAQNAAHSGQMQSHLNQSAAHSGQIAHSSQIAAHSSQMQSVIAHPLAHSSGHAGILASSSHHQPIYSVIGDQIGNIGATGAECTICYENPIDSVLYMCGHMCMCYRCAVQQWRGKGGGQCPLCRAHIKDVIRTYKS